jgi:hypothetical protein
MSYYDSALTSQVRHGESFKSNSHTARPHLNNRGQYMYESRNLTASRERNERFMIEAKRSMMIERTGGQFEDLNQHNNLENTITKKSQLVFERYS